MSISGCDIQLREGIVHAGNNALSWTARRRGVCLHSIKPMDASHLRGLLICWATMVCATYFVI